MKNWLLEQLVYSSMEFKREWWKEKKQNNKKEKIDLGEIPQNYTFTAHEHRVW